ncbi:hypothetical protein OsJ_16597 [Oryza sativa Japonica Group]|uniref:Uncharacterized protein n=1 Tax=Oryza sativa subsp. japonica TaxID=39947 RepID=A3AYJ9_ORYSJ|nr:hypothetical protein OsJ_16597 [Oryza sativa Japonica Group]
MAAAAATAFSCSFASPRHRRSPTTARASGAAVEIRVCTNRTCARQGGREVLAALEGLAPPRVDVASCGCLGRCGAGPNFGASVSGGGAAVFGHGHRRARRAAPGAPARRLRIRRGGRGSPRSRRAIEMNAGGGLHLAYRSRSRARLSMGNITGALADAEEATKIAPKFPQAHLSRGDALFAMEEYRAAEDAYADALDLDPSIRRTKSFRARVQKLREKVANADVSSSS